LKPAAIFRSQPFELGRTALANGEVGVITLAAGVGSRWTQGAGVVKALNPFCKMKGQWRSFLDIHFAKTRAVAAQSLASRRCTL
jgi:hypothetical protein